MREINVRIFEFWILNWLALDWSESEFSELLNFLNSAHS
jgi:hypothetical protein